MIRGKKGEKEMMIGASVKAWYKQAFPTDELGDAIRPLVTFYSVFKALDNYEDVYEVLGVRDSLVRERVFTKLAEIIGVEYEYIYKQWLRA